jgi:hypothetical protein
LLNHPLAALQSDNALCSFFYCHTRVAAADEAVRIAVPTGAMGNSVAAVLGV